MICLVYRKKLWKLEGLTVIIYLIILFIIVSKSGVIYCEAAALVSSSGCTM
jgi:hypothetical protein